MTKYSLISISIQFENIHLGKDVNAQNWYKLYEYNKFANTNTSEFWENIITNEFVSRIVEDFNIIFEKVNNILSTNKPI